MANVNAKSSKKGNVFVRFLGNKNTFTILGLLGCVATLIIGYNVRIRKQISPTLVPYAKQTIEARSVIKEDMIGNVRVTTGYTSTATTLVTSAQKVINLRATYKSNIPRGSLFYSDMLKTAAQMPDSAFAGIEEGNTIYSLAVDKSTTFNNSIRAGDYIDLYLSTTHPETKQLVYAKLIESIKVLAVKDKRGNNILKNFHENGEPSELLFSVDNDLFELLMLSNYVSSPSVTITPVIRNQQYTKDAKETSIANEELKQIILSQKSEKTAS